MWHIVLFHGPALIMLVVWDIAVRSSWRYHVNLVGKATVITEQCCYGYRSLDGLYLPSLLYTKHTGC